MAHLRNSALNVQMDIKKMLHILNYVLRYVKKVNILSMIMEYLLVPHVLTIAFSTNFKQFFIKLIF
jgi:hypothetical protein